MKKSFNALLALLVLALGATQLSCNVNDYCLNCATGDGGNGSDDDANDGGGSDIDAPVDASCVPTGPEICDDKDNDCNGLKDDNVTGENVDCTSQVGACAGGKTVCNPTANCSAADNCDPQSSTANCCMKCTKNPTPEVCDSIDNDCNGTVDQNDPGGGGKCGTDMGECIAGTARCQATSGCDQSLACDNTVAGNNCCVKCIGNDSLLWPGGAFDKRLSAEICNAKDDNCNNNIDEGVTLGACTWSGATDTGQCNIGKLFCVGGVPQCGDLPLDPNGGAAPLENAVDPDDPIFPKFELCNGLNDDCDLNIDEVFNKNIDPLNCGTCNNACPPKSKTCEGGTNARMVCTCTDPLGDCLTDTECPGSKCVVNSQPCCGPTCQNGTTNGNCSNKCNVGFINLSNANPNDGCEYKCSPTGSEECDGVDNDCDGNVDETGATGITVPVGLCLSAGVCNGTTPTCMMNMGWKCNYPAGTYEAVEISCDGLDNNCNSNVDESHPDRLKTCYDGATQPGSPIDKGVCIDQGILVCNGADPDGPLQCVRGENGLMCAIGDKTDDNGDGKVNDGCPAFNVAETNCSEVVANVVDDDGDGYFNDGCPTSALPVTAAGSEVCNGKDDDCDGLDDIAEYTAGGNMLSGIEWITLANGRQMMRFEASRPDATGGATGIGTAIACSRTGVLPWTNITYGDAELACEQLGARLCTESEWHHACSVVPTTGTLAAGVATFAVNNSSTAVIESEDYSTIGVGNAGAAEGTCTGSADDDGDGRVNDGCPKQGTFAESNCIDAIDNDNDTRVNDGCPSFGPSMRSWVSDYTAGYSGIAAMEAIPNTNGGTVTSANAVAQSPRLSFALAVANQADYNIWVKIYQTGFSTKRCAAGTNLNGLCNVDGDCPSGGAGSCQLNGKNDLVYVQIDGGALQAVSFGTTAPTACTMDNQCTALTGGICADIEADNVKDHCAGFTWLKAAATVNMTAAAHTVTVYMGDEGVKVDKVALNVSGTTPADSATPKGNTWAYQNNVGPNAPSDTTCNGHERTAANDDVVATGSLAACYADSGTLNASTGDAFDMSGNVKEWTIAQKPGVNPLRGGASNSTTVGTSCALNFTVADDELQFPNIGYRCCK